MKLLNLSDEDFIVLSQTGDLDETFFTLDADDLVVMAGPSQIPPHLRAYWLGPEGSARVGGWGNKGSWTKCTVELRKEGVPGRMVKGECTNLYHEATGRYPGSKKGGHSVETVTASGDRRYVRDYKGRFAEMPGGSDNKLHIADMSHTEIWHRVQSMDDGDIISTAKGARIIARKHPSDPKKMVIEEQIKNHEGNWVKSDDITSLDDWRNLDIADYTSVKAPSNMPDEPRRRQHLTPDIRNPFTRAGETMTAATETAAAEDTPANPTWSGVLTIEGGESGDGRLFAAGSLDWADLPLPLMYQHQTSGGHSESSYVGNITNITRKGDHILGAGDIDMSSEYGPEAHRLMKENRRRGVSVDVDSVKNADVEFVYEDGVEAAVGNPSMQIFHKGRIRGATMVAFPAFVEAAIELDDCGCDEANAEGVPTVAASTASMNDRPDSDFAYVEPGDKDSSGKTTPRSKRHFPIYDAAHVRNALARMNQSPFGAKARAKIMAAAKKFGITVSDTEAALDLGHVQTAQPVVASSHVIEIPNLPPARWFEEPTDVQLSGALTITDEGRIYGLLVPPDTVHRANGRTEPPNVNYANFMKGETIVEGGGRVVTGPITMSCGHAPTQNYGSYAERIQHYDNSCSVFADVAVGKRADGSTWVAGAVKHYASAEQVSRAMSCTLSGDWQPDRNQPGRTELIGALLVPVPGFPMARAQASVRVEDGMVTASSVPLRYASPDDMLETSANVVIDPNVVALTKRVLAASIGRDPDTRRRELRAMLDREV